MHKLIKEISAIVSQYGVDIVTEERFVNILKDLYPDRDHPEKFDILRALINDGINSEMIATVNANNARSKVEKKAKLLSAKYGYDQQDISQVLYCLCIGCDCISIDDYNALKKQSKPKPTPSKPKGKPKPAPSPSKPNKPSIKSSIRFKDLLGLAIAVCGLVSMPFICFALLESGWWPFFALIFLGIFQFAINLVIGLMIYGNDFNSSDSTAPEIEAGFSVVCFCASIFYISLPFILNNKPYVDSVSSLSFFLVIILCGANGFMGYLGMSSSLDSYVHQTDIKRVIKAASLTLLAILLLFGLLHSKLYIDRYYRTLKSNSDLKRYENEMKLAESIRKTRERNSIDLSFMDFSLGDSLRLCSQIINHNHGYSSYKSHERLKLNGLDYSEFIDTVLFAETDWDNEKTWLHLYFHDKELIAIEVLNNHSLDSLLSLYSKKYGNPERIPHRMYIYEKDNDIETYEKENLENYMWTFSNGIIQLIHDPDVFSFTYSRILYFDRRLENLLTEKNEKIRLRQLETARQDSLKKVRLEEENRRLRIKEIEKQRENHVKSIKQI